MVCRVLSLLALSHGKWKVQIVNFKNFVAVLDVELLNGLVRPDSAQLGKRLKVGFGRQPAIQNYLFMVLTCPTSEVIFGRDTSTWQDCFVSGRVANTQSYATYAGLVSPTLKFCNIGPIFNNQNKLLGKTWTGAVQNFKKSCGMYDDIGQVEEALKVMHFDRLSIFRPAVLLCNREESRPGEAVARAFLKPVSYLFPTAITVPVEVVSHAMINNLVSPAKQQVEVYENKAIHQLSGISSGCGAKQSRSAESSKAK